MSEGLDRAERHVCAMTRCREEVARFDVLCPAHWKLVPGEKQAAVATARMRCNPADVATNDPWSDAMAMALEGLVTALKSWIRPQIFAQLNAMRVRPRSLP